MILKIRVDVIVIASFGVMDYVRVIVSFTDRVRVDVRIILSFLVRIGFI